VCDVGGGLRRIEIRPAAIDARGNRRRRCEGGVPAAVRGERRVREHDRVARAAVGVERREGRARGPGSGMGVAFQRRRRNRIPGQPVGRRRAPRRDAPSRAEARMQHNRSATSRRRKVSRVHANRCSSISLEVWPVQSPWFGGTRMITAAARRDPGRESRPHTNLQKRARAGARAATPCAGASAGARPGTPSGRP
jgi:hypothetical protein